VARELARREIPVTVVGRDGAKANALAAELGPAHRGEAASVTDPEACRRLLAAGAVAVNAAGPFSALGMTLVEACLEKGAHLVDIADDRAYTRALRERNDALAAKGLVAAHGCSSLPGLSGALALLAREGRTEVPVRARATLFIGNRNPKGSAAVASAVSVLGREIATPRGTVRGFRGREVVELPAPFGRRAVYDFESPDYDLLPALTGAHDVAVKVGFELRAATLGFAALAALSGHWGPRAARALAALGSLSPPVGCSGGVVQTELFFESGEVRVASLHGREDGQRLAALPAAIVAEALARGRALPCGARTAYEALGARALAEAVAACGFELSVRDGARNTAFSRKFA
jgi:hypothetical protein